MEPRSQLTLDIHPFTIRRSKLDGAGLWERPTSTRLLTEAERRQRDRHEALRRQANLLADDIGASVRQRDNRRHKLLQRLRRLDAQLINTEADLPDPVLMQRLSTIKEGLQALADRDHTARQEYLERDKAVLNRLRNLYRANVGLRHSTAVVNPEITDRLNRWIEGEDLPRKTRSRLELTLTRIAMRATTKSSPLAYLNTVTILPTGKDRAFRVTGPQITLNQVILLEAYERILLHDDIIDQVTFRLSADHYTQDQEVHIFGLAADPSNRKVFRARDRIVTVRRTAEVDRVLSCGRSHLTTADAAEIVDIPASQGAQVVRRLVDIGLLRPSEYFTDDPSPLAGMLAALSRFRLPTSGPVHEAITVLQNLQDRLTRLNSGYGIAEHTAVVSDLITLSETLGTTTPQPRECLYIDNVAAPDTVHTVDDGTRASLTELLSLYPVFDINTYIQQELIHELETRGIDRVPTSDPTLFGLVGSINLRFASFWSDPFGRFTDSSSPVVRTLDEAKDRFVTGLLHQPGDEQIRVSHELVDTVRRIMPEGLGRTDASYTLFYQRTDCDTIINRIYPGNLSFYQRFLRYTDIPERYRDELNAYYRPDIGDLAEIYETMGFNANSYRPILPTRLTFDLSTDLEKNNSYERVLEFYDLDLVVSDGRLYLSDNEGSLWRPVIASSLIRVMYPGRLAFFSSLFSTISFLTDLATPWLAREEGDIVRSPRIRFDDLVLERRRVLIRGAALKDLQALPSHTWDQARHITRLLERWDLPSTFYYQRRHRRYEASVSSLAQEFAKPEYFDIENPLLVRAFVNTIRRADAILLSEVLPDPAAPEFETEVNLRGVRP